MCKQRRPMDVVKRCQFVGRGVDSLARFIELVLEALQHPILDLLGARNQLNGPACQACKELREQFKQL